MIINLGIKLKDQTLPSDYRPALVSFIKAALSRFYPDAYEVMYGNGAKQKSYTFSVALTSPRFEGSVVMLGGDMLRMSFSSWNEADSLLLYNAFKKSTGTPHPLPNGNTMTVLTTTVAASPHIYDHQAQVKFLSPLVVREHVRSKADRYYIFDDAAFEDCLREIVSRQLGEKTHITIEPIAPKKTVVPAFGVKVRASLGVYTLKASPEVLNFLLKGGIGSRRSEGFGHFILVGGQSNER